MNNIADDLFDFVEVLLQPLQNIILQIINHHLINEW